MIVTSRMIIRKARSNRLAVGVDSAIYGGALDR
jgi:hypothetical protein